MNAALARDCPLRVNLTVPMTAVSLGPIAFDGLKAVIGMDLADVLTLLMIGPRTQRPVLGGVVDVYPLAISDGEGLSVPIKLIGEIGFYNLKSPLVRFVPVAAMDVVRAQHAVEIAASEAAGLLLRAGVSGGTVPDFAVRLKPGMRKAVPLGTLGELGVEAG